MSPRKMENIQKVLKALEGGARGILSLQEATNLSPPCIASAIEILRVNKKVFIQRWDIASNSHNRIAIYCCGAGEDAPRPPTLSQEERNNRYRELRRRRDRNKQESEHLARLERELSRPAFRHWMDVALFGEAVA